MLNLGHPQVVFSQVVRERDLVCDHESQHVALKVSQSLQKVAGFGAGEAPPAALSLTFIRGGALLVGLFEQRSVAFSVDAGIEVVEMTAGIQSRRVDLFEEKRHLLCPLLLVLFPGPLQFPEVVSIAQGMRGAVLIVGLPMVMTQDARKSREDIDRIQGLAPSFGVRVKKGEIGIGGAVQPVAFAADVDASLVGMEQARRDELLSDPTVKIGRA